MLETHASRRQCIDVGACIAMVAVAAKVIRPVLIGDDEHGWGDDGIFNFEGGCYAKAIYLTREAEPEIFDSLRYGAVLENVVYDEADHHVDFANSSINIISILIDFFN